MRSRPIMLAGALAALATLFVSTAAFADTLTVTFTTATPNSSYTQLTGQQRSVWVDTSANKTYTYDGTYVATATGASSNYCINNPQTALTFTSPAAGGLTLQLGNPLCFNKSGFSTTFQILGGSGTFLGVSGGGTAVYSAPQSVVFTGDFDPGSGSQVPVGATPELGSLMLFGSGALGLGSYGLTRLRARRKQPSA